KLNPQLTADTLCFTGKIIDPFNVSKNVDPEIALKIEKVEKELKAAGVECNFDKNNLVLAGVIKNCLHNINKAGFQLPDRVVSESEIFLPFLMLGKPATGFFKFIDPKKPQENQIIYNSLLNWEIPIDNQPPEHHIYHEIGHYLHFKANPEMYLKLFKSAKEYKFKDELRDQIEKEVSLKATENITEFVADVFAGLMQGKQYSDNIMRFYNGFGGQHPPEGWDVMREKI
ncbi:MAG: hypothetical protein AB1782_15395, partial [Cyanobacteriota bacterium]